MMTSYSEVVFSGQTANYGISECAVPFSEILNTWPIKAWSLG